MHRTYIADIERGARNVTLKSIENLAKALQVTVGNLLTFATGPVSGPEAPAARQAVREILLIEDNAQDREITARALTQAMVTNPLTCVSDAEEALEYVFCMGRHVDRKPTEPQLILLDLNLPQMSGLEFLRRIKADKRTKDIPVVALTVSRSDRMILECSRLGAENYIVKPVAIESLIKLVPRLNLHLTISSPPDNRPNASPS